MKFDDITEEIKPWGRYQKINFFLVGLVTVPYALHNLGTVFILQAPDHRCAVPGLDNDTWASQGPWHDEMVKMTIPYDQDQGTFDQCSYYANRNFTDPFNPDNTTASCSKWVYSKDIMETSVVMEMNLVCDDKDKVALARSLLMAGKLFGSLIVGLISDRFGRKMAIMVSLVGQFGVAIATSFVHSYAAFVALRFMTSFFGMGILLAAFVCGLELVGPKQRTVVGIVMHFFYTGGLLFLLLVAYFVRNWRTLQIILSCCGLLLIGHFWLLPESARWLVSKGRMKEASAIVRKAAKVNKADVSEKVLSLQDLQPDDHQKKVWYMFTNTRLLGRSLIIFLNWCVVSMVYYGLNLNIGELSGDLFVNFLYGTLAEIASHIFCLIFLFYIGRRPLHCFSMLFGGAGCIFVIFPVLYAEKGAWVTVTLAMIGRFGSSAAFAIIYIFSAELFPTMVRNSSMGFSSICARIGGVAAPYIPLLENVVTGNFGTALPYVVYGALSVVAGLVALLLPETFNKQLPETIEDAAEFGREKKNSYKLDQLKEPSTKNGDSTKATETKYETEKISTIS